MTRVQLICSAALIALTGACAGQHVSTSPQASVERALTDRFGFYPNTVSVSRSTLHVAYSVYETSVPDTVTHDEALRPLAIRIARTAVAGYGNTAPDQVHVALEERVESGQYINNNFGVRHHDYVFQAKDLAGR